MELIDTPIIIAYAAVVAGLVEAIKEATRLDGWPIRIISWALGIGALAYLKTAGAVDVGWEWIVPYGWSLGLGTNAIYRAGKALKS